MSGFYVTLPNGNKCGIGRYAQAWRQLLGMDPAAKVAGFCHFPERAESVLHALRGGLSERINRHIPGYGVGRRWDNDYYIRMWRDSRRLQDIARRVRVYQFESSEARDRFADRLADWRDQ